MSLVNFSTHNNLAEASVNYSCLKAGGFHPNFQNYNHANLVALYILAFGGIILQLPNNEVEGAQAYLAQIREQPLQESDPIIRRKYGMWKRSVLFACLSYSIGFGSISTALLMVGFIFLTPELLCFFAIPFIIWGVMKGQILAIIWLFFPLMLLHAKYIALPKLRQQHDASR